MILGAFVGSLLTGPIGAHLCRRYSLMLGCLLMIVCVVIMTITTSLGALYFARFLIGVANGLLLNFSMVYLQECAPAHLRGICFGVVTSWIAIGTTIGMVRIFLTLNLQCKSTKQLNQVINSYTADILSRKAYQIPLYVFFVPPVILIFTLPLFPESPRWLLHHKRPEEALRSLRFFREGAFDELALNQEFEAMKDIADREAETEKDWHLIFELFRHHNLRRTIICVGVGTVNAGVGAMFILAFGTYFFQIVSHQREEFSTSLT